MKTILIPVFNKRISARLDCAEYIEVIKIDNNVIHGMEKIKICSCNQLEKLNLILSMKPDTIICNGLTDFYENEFLKNEIKIIPWIHGQFEDVIQRFIDGNLVGKMWK